MATNHNFFAAMHASKESQFYDLPHGLEDTPDISSLRAMLESGKGNPYELSIALADRLCFQLRFREAVDCYTQALSIIPDTFIALRKRAPRYLCILEPAKAFADFLACAKKAPNSLELEYRLGISSYINGDYDLAETFFKRCAGFAKTNPEMLVASEYWLALSSIRTDSGDSSWMGYDFSQPIQVQTGYCEAMKALCGMESPESAIARAVEGANPLDGSIILYGVHCLCQKRGQGGLAEAVLSDLVLWDDFWPSFAYLAAWTEWNREKMRRSLH
jgi:tetratricopeptide (TPR) repeat protein